MLDIMSIMNYKNTQIDKNQARKLVSQIVKSPASPLVFSRHALLELENDDLTTADALNVLKSPDAKIVMMLNFPMGLTDRESRQHIYLS